VETEQCTQSSKKEIPPYDASRDFPLIVTGKPSDALRRFYQLAEEVRTLPAQVTDEISNFDKNEHSTKTELEKHTAKVLSIVEDLCIKGRNFFTICDVIDIEPNEVIFSSSKDGLKAIDTLHELAERALYASDNEDFRALTISFKKNQREYRTAYHTYRSRILEHFAMDYPDLNDTEETLIQALGKETLTGEDMARKTGYPYNSNIKSTLSSLRKRKILDNNSPGYSLKQEYYHILESQDKGQD